MTGYDVADNFTAAPAITFTDDSAGPTGGSVDATGLGGTGGRYSTSTSLSIALDKGTDAGVGLAASGAQLLSASATLTLGRDERRGLRHVRLVHPGRLRRPELAGSPTRSATTTA